MPDNSQQVIVKELQKKKIEDAGHRKKTAQQLIDYYERNYDEVSEVSGLGYFSSWLKTIFPNTYKDITPHISYAPLMDFIVDRVSMTFQEDVIFSILDDEAKTEKLNNEILPANRMQVLKLADSYKTFLNTFPIQAQARNKRIDWDIIKPSALTIVQDENDVTKAVAYCIETTWKNTIGDETRAFTIYTEESIWREDENGKMLGVQDPYTGEYVFGVVNNPYGFLPFVDIHDSLPLDAYFGQMRTDLLNIQNVANRLKTYLMMVSAYSNPVWVFAGIDAKIKPKAGAGTIVTLPNLTDNASVTTVTPDTKMAELQDMLEKHIKLSLNSYHIYPNRETGQVSSGKALIMENTDLMETRKDAVTVWKTYLEELVYKSIKVWELVNGQQLNVEMEDIVVDMPEIEMPVDRETWLANKQTELTMGITSPTKVMMEDNPDLTQEEADKQLKANLSESQQVKNKYLLGEIVKSSEPNL